jgi:hypothetical protein
MKNLLVLFITCCLISACNRPMPQLPITQSSPMQFSVDTYTKTPSLTAKASINTNPTPISLATTTTQTPSFTSSPSPVNTQTRSLTNTPTPGPSHTPKPTSTPYPTPAWCPVESVTPIVSGKLRVVFANQGNLWIWEEGKSSVQLAQSGKISEVIISDDGQVIVFIRELDENHVELWAINPDGSNERRLVSVDELTRLDGSTDALGVLFAHLQWEPGTHNLIFDTYPVYNALWVYEPQVYWLVDVDTGKVSPAPYSGGYITYSPDGTQVAIFDMVGLSLVNIDGSNLREDILEPYQGIGYGEQYYDPSPYWAPDSTSLLVALTDQEDMFDNNATTTLWQIPVAGTPETLGSLKAFAPSISFSPDHTFMTYWLDSKEALNHRELHLTRINELLTHTYLDTVYIRGDMIELLAWSPDSQHFIFQMGDPGKQSQFFYIGDICQPPIKLAQNVGGEFTWVSGGGIATWVDASRYLIEVGLPIYYDKWELHLGKIGSEQTDVLGEVTAYDWAILSP